jgi:hypothetical protein
MAAIVHGRRPHTTEPRRTIMAHVKNVVFRMGRSSGSLEYAEVAFDVDFTPHELAQKLRYGLHVRLFEIDSGLDNYTWTPNGISQVFADWSGGDTDDAIKYLVNEVVQPNGQATQHFVYHKDFNIGFNEIGEEEYRAAVMIIPEIVQGFMWSNEVDINLD